MTTNLTTKDVQALIGVEEALRSAPHRLTLKEMAPFIGVRHHSSVIWRIQRLLDEGVLRRTGAVYSVTAKGARVILETRRVA